MPKLSRLRFVSIGHPNARMQDLLLNMSDQAGLPSDSTIWLRNGGGKSSILSLFFALTRPNRRDFLGSKADAKQRRIEDYILINDRSVVAAEWTLDLQTLGLEDDHNIARFLTGVFYEYSGGNRDSLRRLFFCARVSDAVEETQLPTIPIDMTTPEGTRVRRTLLSFKQAWNALRDKHPSLQFACTENQNEWSERLQSAGIDPGLFGYQLIMNSREGGADELFRFNSPDDFVDFLLELTVEPNKTDGITENLEVYRKQLQRRKHEYLPDLALSTGLVERLTPLVDLHERRLRVQEEASRLTSLYSQIRFSIANDTADFTAQETAAADEIKTLRTAWNATDVQCSRDRGIAIALALRLAEADEARAKKQVEDLTEAVRQATREELLWKAAYPYQNYVIAQRDADTYREALSGSDGAREPLLARLAQAASDYVAAMRHQIDTLTQQREDIRAKSKEMDLSSQEIDQEANQYERQALACEAESNAYLQNLSARQGKFESLIKLDILRATETPSEALERTENALKDKRKKLRSIERGREGDEALGDEYDRQIVDLQRSTATKEAEIKSLEREFQKATEARDKLEADRSFLSALELDGIDLDELPEDTAGMLQRHASEMQEEAAKLRTEAASLERARVHIQERGLMPPTVEVENLLSFLGPKSNARSGWSYISENIPADRQEAVVHAYPGIAQGIVVPSREMERIRNLITSNPEAIPPLPITIATPEALEALPETASRFQCIVGPKDHAWFDRADAQKALENLENRLATIQNAIDQALQTQNSTLNALTKFRAFRAQYPRGWFATTRTKLAQLHVSSEDELATLDERKEEKARLIEKKRSSEQSINKLNTEIQGLVHACDKLRDFVNEVDNSTDIWKKNAQEKQEEAQNHREEAEALRKQAREIRESSRQIFQSAEPLSSQINLYENEISRIKYLAEQPKAKQGNIETLKSDYERLREQVERELTNNELAQKLENAEAQAKKDKKQVMQLIRNVLTLEEVSEAVASLANPNDLEANGERAAEVLAVTQTRKEKAIAELSSFESVRKQQQNEWFGAGKPTIPEGTEISKASVAMFEQSAAAATAMMASIDQAIHDQEKRIANAKHGKEALAKDLERLNSVQRSHAAFLTGQIELTTDHDIIEPTEIGNAISDLEKRLEKYKESHDGLDSSRRSAVTAIRKWVDQDQFANLQNRIITQFRTLDPEALENGAAEFRESLNIRLREITKTLEELETHRNFLAKFLLNAADEGLRLLKLADSASTVPREVPDIGGSRFLRITTKEPTSQTDRLELIQELVDTLVDETVLPTGTKLIQRAVRQIARPFTVRVLNPDPASPQKLIEITETARFSGGEQLTCAILLYCTLANVRARTRGMNRQPTSVLILDNPIGRASRTVFINMQRQFASAMGIQLIYTTAVNDLEALSILPNVVRLRNERTDLNKGHRLLEKDVDISGQLEAIRLARAKSESDETPSDTSDEQKPQAEEGLEHEDAQEPDADA